MLHPTPRVDRWDPWIAIGLLAGLIALGVVLRFVM
jgi:hypothetical protein